MSDIGAYNSFKGTDKYRLFDNGGELASTRVKKPESRAEVAAGLVKQAATKVAANGNYAYAA